MGFWHGGLGDFRLRCQAFQRQQAFRATKAGENQVVEVASCLNRSRRGLDRESGRLYRFIMDCVSLAGRQTQSPVQPLRSCSRQLSTWAASSLWHRIGKLWFMKQFLNVLRNLGSLSRIWYPEITENQIPVAVLLRRSSLTITQLCNEPDYFGA